MTNETSGVPNPAEVAAMQKAADQRALERARGKTVRRRRRLVRGARLADHITPEVASALARLAHPGKTNTSEGKNR